MHIMRLITFTSVVMGVWLVLFYGSACAKALPIVCVQAQCFGVEIVSKPEEMARGLQGRAGLEKNQGMLFVFSADDYHRFWMKDMKFTLDILWIDRGRQVVAVGQNLPPCAADPCPVYVPPQKALYVLEIPAGSAALQGIKTGGVCVFKNIPRHYSAPR